ncbi:hypothetical protein [Mucilaginibacter rigui]|nr:hypothetical protein [Mucilaginibacter rigui]
MNPFEQFTIIIGLLAVLLEGVSYLRSFAKKIFRITYKHTG